MRWLSRISDRSADRVPLTLVLLFALALALPDGAHESLIGLPFDTLPEGAILLLLVPLLVSGSLRTALVSRLGGAVRKALGAVLLGIVVAKLVLLLVGHGGFDSCYRAVDTPAHAHGKCETTFDDPFGLSGRTRNDATLDFGPIPRSSATAIAPAYRSLVTGRPLSATNWRLSFLNDLRFNYFGPGQPPRELPRFSLSVAGSVAAPDARDIYVSYIGEGELQLGSQAVDLPASYSSPRQITLPAPAEGTTLGLEYAYRPADTRGERSTRFAELRLLDSDGEALTAAPIAQPWHLLALLVSGALLVLSGLVLAAYLSYVGIRSSWVLIACVAAAVIARAVPDIGPVPASFVYTAGVAMLFIWFVYSSARGRLLTAWLGISLLSIARAMHDFGALDVVLYRGSGTDFLTNESFALDILRDASLEAGEGNFYFQPGYRYVLFLSRVLFGASDPLLSSLVLAAVAFAVFFVADRFNVLNLHRGRDRFTIAGIGVAVVGVLSSETAVALTRLGTTEAPTWAAVVLALGLLLGSQRRLAWVVGMSLLGSALIIRFNEAPAILVVIAAFLLAVPRSRLRTALACCAVIPVMLALLPLHNLVYGDSATVLPESGNSPTITSFPVERFGDVFTNAEARAQFEDQIVHILYLPHENYESRTTYRSANLAWFVHGLQLAWLGGVVYALLRRRRFRWSAFALLAAPIALLVPFLSWTPYYYYPRHMILGYVLMGVSILYLFSPLARRDNGAAQPVRRADARPPPGSETRAPRPAD